MTYANPHYNPEWKTLLDHHAMEMNHVVSDMGRLAEGGAMESDAYKTAEAEFQRHRQAFEAATRMQHETVQEYAEWLFRSFDVSMSDHGAGIPVLQVDFTALRTVEDADAAWSRINRVITDSANDKRNSLPVGQPEGITAFSDVTSPRLVRSRREFLPRDLYPVGYALAGVETLMTIDEQDDGWHVCFMHDWNAQGASVTNSIKALADAVYREAHANATSQTPEIKGMGAWIGRRQQARKRAAILDPARFHFYEHIPPHGQSGRESFARVLLTFEEGRYRAPRWIHYPIIPQAIQSARFDCAVLSAAAPSVPALCPQLGEPGPSAAQKKGRPSPGGIPWLLRKGSNQGRAEG